MADLEERELLAQPHQSAGRVPTDKGYRTYVNEILEPQTLSKDDTLLIAQSLQALTRKISRLADSMNEILISSARVLADVTDELGIILAPQFNDSVFEKLQFYKIEIDRVLVELSLKNGFVKTVIWEVASGLSAEDLHDISRSLNERLSGLSVAEIRKTIGERTAQLQSGADGTRSGLIRLIAQTADELFNFGHTRPLNFSGANHMIRKPDFNSQSELQALLELLEDSDRFSNLLLSRTCDEPCAVTIGGEHELSEIAGCSLITAQFHVAGASGQIGVFGPKRMPYGRMIPLVQFTAKTLEHLINANATDVHEVMHV